MGFILFSPDTFRICSFLMRISSLLVTKLNYISCQYGINSELWESRVFLISLQYFQYLIFGRKIIQHSVFLHQICQMHEELKVHAKIFSNFPLLPNCGFSFETKIENMIFDAILDNFWFEFRHFNVSSVICKTENILELTKRLVLYPVGLFVLFSDT